MQVTGFKASIYDANTRCQSKQAWLTNNYQTTKKTHEIAIPAFAALTLFFLTAAVILFYFFNDSPSFSSRILTLSSICCTTYLKIKTALCAKRAFEKYEKYKDPQWQLPKIHCLQMAELSAIAAYHQNLSYQSSALSEYVDSGLVSEENIKKIWDLVERYHKKKEDPSQLEKEWTELKKQIDWPVFINRKEHESY